MEHARESHNECTRNTLKYASCSHKWWETLKGSIFGGKSSIPALRGFRDGLMVAPAEKASLLGSNLGHCGCKSTMKRTIYAAEATAIDDISVFWVLHLMPMIFIFWRLNIFEWRPIIC